MKIKTKHNESQGHKSKQHFSYLKVYFHNHTRQTLDSVLMWTHWLMMTLTIVHNFCLSSVLISTFFHELLTFYSNLRALVELLRSLKLRICLSDCYP